MQKTKKNKPLKYMIAAGSRSGSMFMVKLMQAFVNGKMWPLAKVHTARNSVGDFTPTYKAFREDDDIAGFIQTHGIHTLKIEDPGVDRDCFILAEAFPAAKVLATRRPIEKIVNSHGNIKPWGHPAETVVANWIAALDFYEAMHAAGRLKLIDIDRPARFDPQDFAAFVGCKLHEEAEDFADTWPQVNNLKAQKNVSGDTSANESNLTYDDILSRFPEVADADKRYDALL